MNLFLFSSFTIFCIIFSIALHKTKRIEQNLDQDFWEREQKANFTRKKSLDNLNYITIPEEILQMKPDYMTSEIENCLRDLNDLSAFKIYLVDVGLLRRLAQLAPTAFGEGNRLFTEFKGALTENFVLQTLLTQFEVIPRYWSRNNPPYEVDFLIQRENDIFPIEVKSDVNTTSKSLKKFKELFPDQVRLRVRFSLDNLKLDGDVLNIPLFMADQTDRLIGLALEQRPVLH